MAEGVAVGGRAVGGDGTRLDGGPQVGEQGPVLQPGDGLEDRHGELAAQGGRRQQQVPHRLVHPVEPLGPAPEDPRRKDAVRLVRRLPSVSRAPQPARVEQVVEQHLDQVRVACRAFDEPPVDGVGYPLGRCLQTGAGQGPHLRVTEPPQLRHRRGVPLLGGAYEVLRGPRLGAQGAQQQDREVRQVVDDVLDDRDGLRVAVVQVLQQHHAAGVPSQDRQQPQQGLGQLDDGLRVAGGRPAPPLRHQPRQRRVVRGKFRIGRCARGPEVRGERLHQGAEGDDQARGARPAAQHRHPQSVGPVGALTHQPGLTDPRFTDEEQRAPRTPSCGVQGAAQQADLLVTSDDDRRIRTHGRRLLEPYRVRQWAHSRS